MATARFTAGRRGKGGVCPLAGCWFMPGNDHWQDTPQNLLPAVVDLPTPPFPEATATMCLIPGSTNLGGGGGGPLRGMAENARHRPRRPDIPWQPGVTESRGGMRLSHLLVGASHYLYTPVPSMITV